MLRFGWRAQLDYGLAAAGTCFDPLTLTAGTLTGLSKGATGAGGALSAASTIAGGNFAAQAGQMQKTASYAKATQLEQNAGQAIASSQRQMFDTQQRTRLAMSTARARGASAGVDVGVGSPAANQGELAGRGSYQALMDMFNGQSAATGLDNQANAARYEGDVAEIEGEAKQSASYLAAAGTLAGTAGSMTSTYSNYKYPTSSRRGG
jgi:hypothetical protein